MALLSLGLTACQCLVTVSEDAGASDAGILDSGTPDSGFQDAGDADAGQVDAGPSDAGTVDAGSDDGGLADAGSDSGTPDSGVTNDGGDAGAGDADAGTTDAGPRDAGSPVEVCDGIDNNLNGVIDEGLDGGPLTRRCPLTLGVCAGALSFCRDGGWAPCDYGPNYQLTERNCDGLDNDCDGRIDVSWARVLLAADAGRFTFHGWPADGSLSEYDTMSPFVLAQPTGFWLSLPSQILVVTDDLGVEQSLSMPLAGPAVILQDGADFLRVATTAMTVEANSLGCVAAHTVQRDGGYPIGPDGGPAQSQEACWPEIATVNQLAVVPAVDGWLAAIGSANYLGALGWALFQGDGGLQSGLVDAGHPLSSAYLTPSGAEIVITPWAPLTGPRASPSSFSAPPPLFSPLPSWGVGPSDPTWTTPINWCINLPSSQQLICYASDGGTLSPAFVGYPIHGSRPTADIYLAVVPNPSAPSEWVLSRVNDGGLELLARFDLGTDGGAGLLPVWETIPSVHEVGGRLLFVTWNGGIVSGTCPACVIDGFYAEYVCTP